MKDKQVVISTTDLKVGYSKEVDVLSEINFNLKAGEVAAIIGRNGSGKSTFVKSIAGLVAKLDGQVNIGIDQQPIELISRFELAKLISIVSPSNSTVVNSITVQEMILLGRTPYLGWLGKYSEADRNVATNCLEKLGIVHLKDKKVASLSDGEQQKVNLARALCQDTPIIMMDEPTAFLDWINRKETLELIGKIARVEQKAIILCTHQLLSIQSIVDSIWVAQNKSLQKIEQIPNTEVEWIQLLSH